VARHAAGAHRDRDLHHRPDLRRVAALRPRGGAAQARFPATRYPGARTAAPSHDAGALITWNEVLLDVLGEGAAVRGGAEHEQVEMELIRQLRAMGWAHVDGLGGREWAAHAVPEESERARFLDVILERRLRKALCELNPGPDGKPWLDEPRLAQAIAGLTRVGAGKLVEANRRATEALTNGVQVDGLAGWHGGRDQTVRFIDWAEPARNDFLVVSQFRVDIPGGQGTHVVPDLVLFVNGIPLVVVECKEPDAPIATAIEQLLRYANRRGADEPEGNERLFHTVQLMVATTGQQARVGSITSATDDYVVWRDPYPLTGSVLAAALGKREDELTQQEMLAAGALHPERLLDIVRNYVLFMQVNETIVKAVPRYQQYRAVDKAVRRLRTGKTKQQDGERDRRGGIIWHTQGSGKSLTMVFLIRKLRATAELQGVKVVIVTDRRDLQRQLGKTAELSGEKIDIARNTRQVRAYLSRRGPGVVFAMIQKQRDAAAATPYDKSPSLGELNTDEDILILIDEAHRSHTSTFHKNLTDALPNAARIGFTGTPIIMGAKTKTRQIFGPTIDEYRLKDAEADGAIVPIFYEGHTVKGAVRDGRDLDEVFEDLFGELSAEDRAALQRRYATRGSVLESQAMIADKARHMLRHYVANVLPGGLKAQLVANSRTATVRYRAALIRARDELVAELESRPADIVDGERAALDRRESFLAAARPYLPLLKVIDFVPIISGEQNDPPALKPWIDGHQSRIDEFLKDFPDEPADGDRPVAFLLVKSMLLTGFDAPVEQVLYLDRPIKEAELLQAIARTNRTRPGKQRGLVVDYFGVANHLEEALAAYDADDSADTLGALRSVAGEIDALRPKRNRLRMLFTDHGVTPLPDERSIEECVHVLRPEAVRAYFTVLLRDFLTTVDAVLPRPEVGPYLPDATLYAEIAARARRRYQRGIGAFDPSQYGAKVRDLIDRHLVSLGISAKIPPIALTAPGFKAAIGALSGSRAKASEMEHAIRHHLEVHLGEDPVRYRRLQDRLEEILRKYHEQWDRQVALFDALIDELHSDRDPHGPVAGLSPLERALFRLLAEGAREGSAPELVRDAAVRLRETAERHAAKAGLWNNEVALGRLRADLTAVLFDLDLSAYEPAEAQAGEVFDVVRAHLG
jgi:type I restriction enzyme R subunit